MMQTISFIRASIARAKQEGMSNIPVSLLDLEELVRAAESHVTRDAGQQARKSAGWVRPGSLNAMRSGVNRNAKIRSKKDDEFCVELFFSGSLFEMHKAAEAKKITEPQVGKECN